MVSHLELKRILRYSPTTGVFRRRVASWSNIHPIGSIAGGMDKRGYIHIQINGRLYAAHRLAWFYMTGYWPRDTIDHRDLNKSNNRWLNLREATKAQQAYNRRAFGNGLKGVCFYKNTGRWVSKIRFKGERIYLGSFGTEEEAHAAYKKAAIELFGEFARAA